VVIKSFLYELWFFMNLLTNFTSDLSSGNIANVANPGQISSSSGSNGLASFGATLGQPAVPAPVQGGVPTPLINISGLIPTELLQVIESQVNLASTSGQANGQLTSLLASGAYKNNLSNIPSYNELGEVEAPPAAIASGSGGAETLSSQANPVANIVPVIEKQIPNSSNDKSAAAATNSSSTGNKTDITLAAALNAANAAVENSSDDSTKATNGSSYDQAVKTQGNLGNALEAIVKAQQIVSEQATASPEKNIANSVNNQTKAKTAAVQTSLNGSALSQQAVAGNIAKPVANQKENELVAIARRSSIEEVVSSKLQQSSGLVVSAANKDNKTNSAGNNNQTNSLLSPQTNVFNSEISSNKHAAAPAQFLNTVNVDSIQQLPANIQSVDSRLADVAKAVQDVAVSKAHDSQAEQLGMKIASAVRSGDTKIILQLEPASLGRVEVRIDMPHDGRVSIAVMADKHETLDMLQKDSRSLEKALSDAGIKTDSGSLNFSLRNQNPNAQQFAGEGNRAYQYANNISGDDELSAALEAEGEMRIYQSDNVLDIRV